jgi:hypothetical protein
MRHSSYLQHKSRSLLVDRGKTGGRPLVKIIGLHIVYTSSTKLYSPALKICASWKCVVLLRDIPYWESSTHLYNISTVTHIKTGVYTCNRDIANTVKHIAQSLHKSNSRSACLISGNTTSRLLSAVFFKLPSAIVARDVGFL